jgi:hypothetical protein
MYFFFRFIDAATTFMVLRAQSYRAIAANTSFVIQSREFMFNRDWICAGRQEQSCGHANFMNHYTSNLGLQIFPNFVWLILVRIKLKTFGELSFVLPSISGATDNLGTNGA